MKKPVYLSSANASKYLTVEEAAAQLEIKPTVVRNYLCEGKFKTYKFKTLTLLASGEVAAWRQRRRGV
jgi:hypothetical protein